MGLGLVIVSIVQILDKPEIEIVYYHVTLLLGFLDDYPNYY